MICFCLLLIVYYLFLYILLIIYTQNPTSTLLNIQQSYHMLSHQWKNLPLSPTSAQSSDDLERTKYKKTLITSELINKNGINHEKIQKRTTEFFAKYRQGDASKRSISYKPSNSPSINKIYSNDKPHSILQNSPPSQQNVYNPEEKRKSPQIRLQSPQNSIASSRLYNQKRQIPMKSIRSKMANTLREQVIGAKSIKISMNETKKQIKKQLMVFMLEIKKAIKQTQSKFSNLNKEYHNPNFSHKNNGEEPVQVHINVETQQLKRINVLNLRKKITQKTNDFSKDMQILQKIKQNWLSKINKSNET